MISVQFPRRADSFIRGILDSAPKKIGSACDVDILFIFIFNMTDDNPFFSQQ